MTDVKDAHDNENQVHLVDQMAVFFMMTWWDDKDEKFTFEWCIIFTVSNDGDALKGEVFDIIRSFMDKIFEVQEGPDDFSFIRSWGLFECWKCWRLLIISSCYLHRNASKLWTLFSKQVQISSRILLSKKWEYIYWWYIVQSIGVWLTTWKDSLQTLRVKYMY